MTNQFYFGVSILKTQKKSPIFLSHKKKNENLHQQTLLKPITLTSQFVFNSQLSYSYSFILTAVRKTEPLLSNNFVVSEKKLKTFGEKSNCSENYTFFNRPFDKGRLKALIHWSIFYFGEKKTVDLVEKFKTVGYSYATKAGISLSIDDLKIPALKNQLLVTAEQKLDLTNQDVEKGYLTTIEYFVQVIDTWNKTSERIKKEVIDNFKATDVLNPVYMMAFSGARGNISQVRQLVGMRGLMADPQGRIIDFPIQSNFREGLTLTEYVISCYGARKGVVDTALRTATSGYLTRRLVDVAQHVIVRFYDCGTTRGVYLADLKSGTKTILKLKNRLIGRVLAENIYNVKQQKIASKNQEITTELAILIEKTKKSVLVRSPLTCKDKNYVCQLCYGWSLAHSRLVTTGEAVGIIAAQSIGEPGTQLTMRTFHTGGVFSGDVSDEIRAPFTGRVSFSKSIPGKLIRTTHGQIAFLTKQESELILISEENKRLKPENVIIKLSAYSLLFVKQNQLVSKQQVLAEAAAFLTANNQSIESFQTVYSELSGEVRFQSSKRIQKIKEPVMDNLLLNQLNKLEVSNPVSQNSKLKSVEPGLHSQDFSAFQSFPKIKNKSKETLKTLFNPTTISKTGEFWILSAQKQTILKPINLFVRDRDFLNTKSVLFAYQSILPKTVTHLNHRLPKKDLFSLLLNLKKQTLNVRSLNFYFYDFGLKLAFQTTHLLALNPTVYFKNSHYFASVKPSILPLNEKKFCTQSLNNAEPKSETLVTLQKNIIQKLNGVKSEIPTLKQIYFVSNYKTPTGGFGFKQSFYSEYKTIQKCQKFKATTNPLAFLNSFLNFNPDFLEQNITNIKISSLPFKVQLSNEDLLKTKVLRTKLNQILILNQQSTKNQFPSFETRRQRILWFSKTQQIVLLKHETNKSEFTLAETPQIFSSLKNNWSNRCTGLLFLQKLPVSFKKIKKRAILSPEHCQFPNFQTILPLADFDSPFGLINTKSIIKNPCNTVFSSNELTDPLTTWIDRNLDLVPLMKTRNRRFSILQPGVKIKHDYVLNPIEFMKALVLDLTRISPNQKNIQHSELLKNLNQTLIKPQIKYSTLLKTATLLILLKKNFMMVKKLDLMLLNQIKTSNNPKKHFGHFITQKISKNFYINKQTNLLNQNLKENQQNQSCMNKKSWDSTFKVFKFYNSIGTQKSVMNYRGLFQPTLMSTYLNSLTIYSHFKNQQLPLLTNLYKKGQFKANDQSFQKLRYFEEQWIKTNHFNKNKKFHDLMKNQLNSHLNQQIFNYLNSNFLKETCFNLRGNSTLPFYLKQSNFLLSTRLKSNFRTQPFLVPPPKKLASETFLLTTSEGWLCAISNWDALGIYNHNKIISVGHNIIGDLAFENYPTLIQCLPIRFKNATITEKQDLWKQISPLLFELPKLSNSTTLTNNINQPSQTLSNNWIKTVKKELPYICYSSKTFYQNVEKSYLNLFWTHDKTNPDNYLTIKKALSFYFSIVTLRPQKVVSTNLLKQTLSYESINRNSLNYYLRLVNFKTLKLPSVALNLNVTLLQWRMKNKHMLSETSRFKQQFEASLYKVSQLNLDNKKNDSTTLKLTKRVAESATLSKRSLVLKLNNFTVTTISRYKPKLKIQKLQVVLVNNSEISIKLTHSKIQTFLFIQKATQYYINQTALNKQTKDLQTFMNKKVSVSSQQTLIHASNKFSILTSLSKPSQTQLTLRNQILETKVFDQSNLTLVKKPTFGTTFKQNSILSKTNRNKQKKSQFLNLNIQPMPFFNWTSFQSNLNKTSLQKNFSLISLEAFSSVSMNQQTKMAGLYAVKKGLSVQSKPNAILLPSPKKSFNIKLSENSKSRSNNTFEKDTFKNSNYSLKGAASKRSTKTSFVGNKWQKQISQRRLLAVSNSSTKIWLMPTLPKTIKTFCFSWKKPPETINDFNHRGLALTKLLRLTQTKNLLKDLMSPQLKNLTLATLKQSAIFNPLNREQKDLNLQTMTNLLTKSQTLATVQFQQFQPILSSLLLKSSQEMKYLTLNQKTLFFNLNQKRNKNLDFLRQTISKELIYTYPEFSNLSTFNLNFRQFGGFELFPLEIGLRQPKKVQSHSYLNRFGRSSWVAEKFFYNTKASYLIQIHSNITAELYTKLNKPSFSISQNVKIATLKNEIKTTSQKLFKSHHKTTISSFSEAKQKLTDKTKNNWASHLNFGLSSFKGEVLFASYPVGSQLDFIYKKRAFPEIYFLTDADLITWNIAEFNKNLLNQKVNHRDLTGLNFQTEQKNNGFQTVNYPNFKVKLGQYVRYGTEVIPGVGIPQSGQVFSISKNELSVRRAKPFLLSSGGICNLSQGEFVTNQSPLLTLTYKSLKTEDIVQGIPKIEQLFEARENIQEESRLNHLVQTKFSSYKKLYPKKEAVRKSVEFIQQFIVDGIQNVYQSQGVNISDKHIEIIVKQMTSKVKITEPGSTGLLRGDIVYLDWIELVNSGFDGRKAQYEPLVLGITKASLEMEGFISAASFQETIKILSKSAILQKRDFLRGLKENVILGHLLPAGTGFELPF